MKKVQTKQAQKPVAKKRSTLLETIVNGVKQNVLQEANWYTQNGYPIDDETAKEIMEENDREAAELKAEEKKKDNVKNNLALTESAKKYIMESVITSVGESDVTLDGGYKLQLSEDTISHINEKFGQKTSQEEED